jgi:hypothetical protein
MDDARERRLVRRHGPRDTCPQHESESDLSLRAHGYGRSHGHSHTGPAALLGTARGTCSGRPSRRPWHNFAVANGLFRHLCLERSHCLVRRGLALHRLQLPASDSVLPGRFWAAALLPSTYARRGNQFLTGRHDLLGGDAESFFEAEPDDLSRIIRQGKRGHFLRREPAHFLSVASGMDLAIFPLA